MMMVQAGSEIRVAVETPLTRLTCAWCCAVSPLSSARYGNNTSDRGGFSRFSKRRNHPSQHHELPQQEDDPSDALALLIPRPGVASLAQPSQQHQPQQQQQQGRPAAPYHRSSSTPSWRGPSTPFTTTHEARLFGTSTQQQQQHLPPRFETIALARRGNNDEASADEETGKRKWSVPGAAVVAGLVWAVTTLPWVIAQTAMAAVTGGAIRGSVVPDNPSRGGGRESSSSSRYERPLSRPRSDDYFNIERPRAATKLPSIRLRDMDTGTDWEVGGRELKKRDVLVLGGVTAAAIGQNEVRKRVSGLGGEKGIYTVGFQVALYDVIGVMTSFQRLAQRAETTTSAGLASLASNVCLELLRSLDSVVAAKAFTGRHTTPVEAEKLMHEVGIKERKKWAYETTSPQQQQPPRLDPRLGRGAGQGGLMVVTLMVVSRKFDKGLSRTVNSVQSLETSLEKLATLLLERGGKNVLAVDVSWTPDDPADVLSREELRTKWPDLFDF